MSRFFIHRPVFAWVIAILMVVAGILAIRGLSVNQYPSIAPPAISISITYPGASAETVQNTAVQVIEQQLTGIDNLRYLESNSNSDGSATIIATFEQGTDPDIAQVQVQNKVSVAETSLPEEVTEQGVTVAKYQSNFMMVIGLVSKDGKLSDADLGDLLVSKLEDPIARTKGVGDFMVMGSEYAMRVWMDPSKLFKYGLMPSDLSTAIESQNTQVSSGKVGGLPTAPGTQYSATVVGKTRLNSAEQFRNILLKVNSDGSQIRLKDVANVDLGPEDYSISSTYNGKPSVGMALRLATGTNLLDTVTRVRATVDQLKGSLPPGVELVLPYDTSPVVSASIHEVVKTLIEAIVLVFFVMLIFLQNFRATVITTLVVPVVLMGTFCVLYLFGYSINTLSMFGMVLAIGLLVDDAIVVVENVERVMEEEGLSPQAATLKSMQEVQGALFGIALVLSAVLLPMAFFGGSTGIIYRQFSVTIVSAMALSVLTALIFTPALCATLLKPVDPQRKQRGIAGIFNRSFARGTEAYTRSVGGVIKRRLLFVCLYIGVVAGTVYLFISLPSTFLPEEDQAVLMVQATLPQNASAERTQAVIKQIDDYFLTQEKGNVDSVFAANGFSFAGRGQNGAIAFVKLKLWQDRPEAQQKVSAIAARAMAHFAQNGQAKIIVMVPPAVMELGNSSGFDMYLEDQGNQGHAALMQTMQQFLKMANQDPRLSMVRHNGMDDEAQYQLSIDEEKAKADGLSESDINSTLSAAWGGSYVNQFLYNGRVKNVYLQGRATARITPEDLNKWYVRNSSSEMVPFSAFGGGYWTMGSPRYERFNGVSAVNIQGSPAEGYSSSDAVKAVEEIAAKLPQGYTIAWHGLSYEEQVSGSQTPLLYGLSVLIVFLCLAALYESWSVPFAVLLVVPLGIIGTVTAVMLRDIANDVFFQVGLLTTVGLAAKNAILIIEFAKELTEQGRGVVEAAVEAARLRIRPIIMTSMAFILGVLPLTISNGAGAGSQHSIGTAVIGGMLSATFLAIFMVPLFYVLVVSLTQKVTRALSSAKDHPHE